MKHLLLNILFTNFATPRKKTSLQALFYGKKTIIAVVAQLVEHGLPKPRVASSSLVYRSISKRCETGIYAPFPAFCVIRAHSLTR